jgi:hypothetical protein
MPLSALARRREPDVPVTAGSDHGSSRLGLRQSGDFDASPSDPSTVGRDTESGCPDARPGQARLPRASHSLPGPAMAAASFHGRWAGIGWIRGLRPTTATVRR